MSPHRGKDTTRVKPAGKRIREICEVLEEYGPMKAAEISKLLPHITSPDSGEYCAIGVFDGYLTVQKSLKRCGPSVWTVKQNWQYLMDYHMKPTSTPAPVNTTRWAGISSVFNMGAAS